MHACSTQAGREEAGRQARSSSSSAARRLDDWQIDAQQPRRLGLLVRALGQDPAQQLASADVLHHHVPAFATPTQTRDAIIHGETVRPLARHHGDDDGGGGGGGGGDHRPAHQSTRRRRRNHHYRKTRNHIIHHDPRHAHDTLVTHRDLSDSKNSAKRVTEGWSSLRRMSTSA
jgi:hypothetical protein